MVNCPPALSYLRLRERGRTCGDRRPQSSSVMLSVLPKCLDRKCSSSMVGWKGSWCRRSWEELDDCRDKEGTRLNVEQPSVRSVGFRQRNKRTSTAERKRTKTWKENVEKR